MPQDSHRQLFRLQGEEGGKLKQGGNYPEIPDSSDRRQAAAPLGVQKNFCQGIYDSCSSPPLTVTSHGRTGRDCRRE